MLVIKERILDAEQVIKDDLISSKIITQHKVSSRLSTVNVLTPSTVYKYAEFELIHQVTLQVKSEYVSEPAFY